MGQMLSQATQSMVQGPGLQSYAGVSAEVENILKEAHEAYRKGEYMQALQLSHAVHPWPSLLENSFSVDDNNKQLQ